MRIGMEKLAGANNRSGRWVPRHYKTALTSFNSEDKSYSVKLRIKTSSPRPLMDVFEGGQMVGFGGWTWTIVSKAKVSRVTYHIKSIYAGILLDNTLWKREIPVNLKADTCHPFKQVQFKLPNHWTRSPNGCSQIEPKKILLTLKIIFFT